MVEGASRSGSGSGKLRNTGHFFLPSPTQAQSLCQKASALTLVPSTTPASEEAGTGNCDCEVFQVPMASATGAHRPLHPRPAEGTQTRGRQEAGDVGWGWKARRAGETVLDSGGRTEPPDPARLQPRSREPLPKELHALLLRLYGDPRAGTFTQYKKGAKKPKQVVNFSSPSRGEVFSL